MPANARKPGGWKKEIDDLARAFSGAFLFGVPLLFTMEMWWIGQYIEVWKLLLFLVIALGVNSILAYFAGFRDETSLWANVSQAVEAMAVGAVAAAAMLTVLNQVNSSMPLDSILGKIIIQSVPLSIGASAASALLSRVNGGEEGTPQGSDNSEGQEKPPGVLQATLRDAGKTIAGGLFIGFSIAPTEEVPMLAAALSYGHELALMALTLGVTYLIVFESDFRQRRGERRRNSSTGDRGPFQRPVTETTAAYAVSLLVALVVLFLFDQVEGGDTLGSILSQMLVLGVPTAIGGAAGRVLI